MNETTTIPRSKITFKSNGSRMFICKKNKKIDEYKLAFAWDLHSAYNGSRLAHIVKRFFTTLRIHEYKV